MQGPAWIGLLRKLPVTLHDGIVVVMTNSAEIVVQSIVRAERDYLVLRGRMSGSMDPGRVVFVPFDQVNYLALTKQLTQADLQALLSKPAAAAADSAAVEFEPFVPERPADEAPPVESGTEAVPG